jgi:hypothetical protein
VAYMIDVHDMVVRLREEAKGMLPNSHARLLLREAASTIERLDDELRRHAGEVGRLASELAQGAA